jgi:hypothetical protein
MIYLGILLCLIEGASLQASATESLQASHHSALQIEKPVAVDIEQPFAFVYNDNAKVTPFAPGTNGIYLTKNPLIFNSQGPSKNIKYDSRTGELIVQEAGNYEITYGVSTVSHADMMLVVNGKNLRPSLAHVGGSYGQKFGLQTALFVQHLNKGDRVGLSLVDTSGLDSNGGIGISASLSMLKL